MQIYYKLIMKRKTLAKLVSYLGAGVKSGQGIDGVQNGPQAIRKCGILKMLQGQYNVNIKDYGDIFEDPSKAIRHNTTKPYQHTFQNTQILDDVLQRISTKIQNILDEEKDDHILLTVGGDHSVATGTIHGMLKKYQKNLKVIWVDAHADILDAATTEYTGYHGTPLAHVLGVNDVHKKIKGFQWLKRRLPKQNIVHIGWRQLNQGEIQTMRKWGIRRYTPDHIDQYGIGQVMRRTLQYLDPNNDSNTPFHISFDIDALDPVYASATGTTNRGGLTPREACHIIRRTVFEKKLVSMDLVQINPVIQKRFRETLWGDNYYENKLGETVGMGADLIQSLFNRGLQ